MQCLAYSSSPGTHCDTGRVLPPRPSSTSLFAYILHTASVLATAQPVCRCLQVWNTEDAQDEVLVMVVRCLLCVSLVLHLYVVQSRTSCNSLGNVSLLDNVCLLFATLPESVSVCLNMKYSPVFPTSLRVCVMPTFLFIFD